MKTPHSQHHWFTHHSAGGMLALLVMLVFMPVPGSAAGTKAPPPEKIKAIMIGDRVVDIAYSLGVLPEAMSVRSSIWPMAKTLKVAGQILGCPMRTTVRKQDTIPKALEKYGITRVIVEKSDPFCLYMPQVKPDNIARILELHNVTIEYVDFSQGLASAVLQTAKLLNREDKAASVIHKYRKSLASVTALLPALKSGKKVIIINGTYLPGTGRSFLRVEAPGGYADRFLLSPMGLVNGGDCFKPKSGKASKGYYSLRKTKNGVVLDPLIKADPDIIVMTGDALAVQRALADYHSANPALARVKAVQNMALYALPAYVDSSVLEYPDILLKWMTLLDD